MSKRFQILPYFEDDVSAAAAVAAIGSAFRDVFFTSKCSGAAAARSGGYFYDGFIDERQ